MSIDVYPNPVDVILGTMATQNANNVAITGGQISVGGHAPTGVLDVQGSVVASDAANFYTSVRVWPVVPAGATWVEGVSIQVPTGAGLSTSQFHGVHVTNPPTGWGSTISAVLAEVSSGTGRYNIDASGTAQNYFAGNVGCGNSAPSHPLDVTGNVRITGALGIGGAPNHKVEIYYDRSTYHGMQFHPTADTGPGSNIVFNNASASAVGTITNTSSTTSYNTSSDVRLKHAVQTMTDALPRITALHPVSYRWNVDDSPGEGFLAHELQQVIPAAVTGEPDALNDDGSIRPQQVDLSKLVPWLTAAMQELVGQVETLTARITELEARLA